MATLFSQSFQSIMWRYPKYIQKPPSFTATTVLLVAILLGLLQWPLNKSPFHALLYAKISSLTLSFSLTFMHIELLFFHMPAPQACSYSWQLFELVPYVKGVCPDICLANALISFKFGSNCILSWGQCWLLPTQNFWPLLSAFLFVPITFFIF